VAETFLKNRLDALREPTVDINHGRNAPLNLTNDSKLDDSYSLSYQESAFGNCPSADTTLSSAYCAGNHLLTSITPTVYQNGTGHTPLK